MLINVKMPTIVGFLDIYEHDKNILSLDEYEASFITSDPICFLLTWLIVFFWHLGHRKLSIFFDMLTCLHVLLLLSVKVNANFKRDWYMLLGLSTCACANQEGGQGVRTPPPLKSHKNIGVSSDTGLAPLKNHSY